MSILLHGSTTQTVIVVVGITACLAGCAEDSTGTAKAEAREQGEIVWSGTCSRCHGDASSDAPQIGNRTAWQPRIAQGTDVLLRHALEGFTGNVGEMPPRGGNPALAAEDVEAALLYMVGRSQ